jgi:hypothetical protein
MSSNENNGLPQRDDLDLALREMLADQPDERQTAAAAARVWAKLAAAADPFQSAGPAAAAPTGAPLVAGIAGGSGPAGGLPGCDGFRRDMAAFLRGELAAPRAMLLEDHTRECLPCRRALQIARQEESGAGRPAAAAGEAAKMGAARRRTAQASRLSPWLAAAALLAVSLAGGLLWRYRPWGAPQGSMARLQAVEGQVYRVAGATSVALRPGEPITQDEEVRTAKGSRAVLRMTDGSQIEMAERASLSLAAGRAGNTIDLARGRIIVQAAHQRPRHLYVATSDCLVSVTGTIFEVNHGIKGSRVSVVEGEVHVKQARLDFAGGGDSHGSPGSRGSGSDVEEAVLHPGQQVSTSLSVQAVPVRQEVAWSRDAARYQSLLAAVTAVGQSIDQQVARAAVRTSSTLLDLVPAGTLFYVALPNLSSSLVQTEQILEQRLAQTPLLEAWWTETLGSPANAALFHQLIQEVADAGQYVGDEVVIAAGSAAAAGAGTPAFVGPGAPVLVAQATQEAPLKAALVQEAALINQRQGRTALVVLDQLPDPSAPAAAGASTQLLLWVGQGLLVASPSAAQIVAVAANVQAGKSAPANPFVASSFHARLAQVYADGGAGWLVGADLQRMIAGRRAQLQSTAKLTEASGLLDLQDFILERHDAPGVASQGSAAGTDTRASLIFSQQRRGVASWLAAPAPLGSLGFFSADANLVAAFAVKSPVDLLDELLALSPQLAASLATAEAKHGFDLRADLAAPLGGEIALGLDGPLLPSPAWELVVEVYDPVRLQQTIAGAVQQVNTELLAAGKPVVTLTTAASGGLTYYTIAASSPPLEVHYLFTDGYLVAAPTQAALARALAQRAAGTSLAASARLRGLLGSDGQVNVSALFYQNLPPILGSIGTAAAQAVTGRPFHTKAGASRLAGVLNAGGAGGPSLTYAYAEADRIVFAGHRDAGPMGLNLETLASFGGVLGTLSRAHAAAAQGEGRP